MSALTAGEARRLLPELTAAVMVGEPLADVLSRTATLPAACDVQCCEMGGCGHVEHERFSEWLTGCLMAELAGHTAAMWALAECRAVIETEATP